MQICIFEDKFVRNFEPFTFYRPVFDLVCGINTLREKLLRYYPGYDNMILCRDILAAVMKERHPELKVNEFSDDNYLLLNGSILADDTLPDQININRNEEVLFVQKEKLAGAVLKGARLRNLLERGDFIPDLSCFDGIRTVEVNVNQLSYSFDLLRHNHDQLIADYKFMDTGKVSGKIDGVHIIEPGQVIIGEGTNIKPGVVIDASGGPVVIGKESIIYPNAVIEGPAYIGDKTLIKSCSTIYSNVSIGKRCKVGGEVEDLIMLNYSNKQHAGFIGHAYLGSWVNLGADTNCSDLKNNYSHVRINIGSGELNTGMQFLGLLMGDHSKSAINTMFNTGTVVGFSSNIFGAGFPEKYIPSFSWGGSEGFIEYELEKSIDTAKKVFSRRSEKFTSSEEELFKNIFEITRRETLKKETVK